MDFSNHKAYIENLIINGEVTIAIKELLNGTRDHQEKLYNDVVQLSGRHSRNEKLRLEGRIDERDYNLAFANILHALNSYLAKYEPKADFAFPSVEN